MDSVLGWLTVTAGVFYFFGVLFRQGVLEINTTLKIHYTQKQ